MGRREDADCPTMFRSVVTILMTAGSAVQVLTELPGCLLGQCLENPHCSLLWLLKHPPCGGSCGWAGSRSLRGFKQLARSLQAWL